MMMNMEQIMELMNQGMTADEIAKSFTENLNAAVKKQEETKNMTKQKIADAEDVLNVVLAFGEKYYPEIFKPDFRKAIDVTKLIDVMDQARDETVRMIPHMEALKEKLERLHPEMKVKMAKPVPRGIDPIAEFLKAQNLM